MKPAFSILFVATLVIAACGGEGGDTTTNPAAGESTTTAPEETSTTAGGAETSTTAGGSAGGDDCLVGTWVLNDEAFFEQVFADMDEETTGFGDVTAAGGTFTTVFEADGSVEAIRADWGFSVDTDQGMLNIVINGTQTGTWETDGSTLLLTLDEGSGFDVEATVVIDGEEIALPSAPMDVPAEALSSSSEFTCSGDTLAVTGDGITSEFERA
ncbi:MAG TPA: hypothetical protein VMO52_02815 [Acidimicrobiia bacterium]|nr:hypothetical protein [Acidimicrobiia bacterium]